MRFPYGVVLDGRHLSDDQVRVMRYWKRAHWERAQIVRWTRAMEIEHSRMMPVMIAAEG